MAAERPSSATMTTLPARHDNRYQLMHELGRGSYGVVFKAWDTHARRFVAIKRNDHPFDHFGSAVRVLREITFLRLLKSHENIVTLTDICAPGSADECGTVYLVFECMTTDLHRLLNSPRQVASLTTEHVRFIMFQLLRALAFMHARKVLHRDLKPSNILINNTCEVRLCDFGLSRAFVESSQTDFVFWTDYVATRWYRAPELILQFSANYEAGIDIWAAGCVFGELLTRGRPMFPGQSFVHQVELMVVTLGKPPTSVTQRAEPRIRSLMQQLPEPALSHERECTARDMRVRRLQSHFSVCCGAGNDSPGVELKDNDAIDLLAGMLDWNPSARITALDALRHPYFSSIYRREYEPVLVQPICRSECMFENLTHLAQLRTAYLTELVKHYHPQLGPVLLPSPAADAADKGAHEQEFRRRLRLVSQAERLRAMFKLAGSATHVTPLHDSLPDPKI
ncbi:Mitogen-activated protein kinase 8 [Porphyridium purpureum]|uniref:Mitogen-activated protein kinase n=1 Tax=Porphyridium purpureum TaxID=35688 RepID=A0A5J4YRN2_PORPP|nr:Mitogen-activated protein kinase 8 [Porphyridium purpureum]|eukprot:POR6147..scf229_5